MLFTPKTPPAAPKEIQSAALIQISTPPNCPKISDSVKSGANIITEQITPVLRPPLRRIAPAVRPQIKLPPATAAAEIIPAKDGEPPSAIITAPAADIISAAANPSISPAAYGAAAERVFLFLKALPPKG